MCVGACVVSFLLHAYCVCFDWSPRRRFVFNVCASSFWQRGDSCFIFFLFFFRRPPSFFVRATSSLFLACILGVMSLLVSRLKPASSGARGYCSMKRPYLDNTQMAMRKLAGVTLIAFTHQLARSLTASAMFQSKISVNPWQEGKTRCFQPH